MPTETLYTDPATGEALADPYGSAVSEPFDTRGYTGDARHDPAGRNIQRDPVGYPGDSRLYDEAADRRRLDADGSDADYVDPVTGAVTRHGVPYGHASLSELNELKMDLHTKHARLAGAIGALSQSQSSADFNAAKNAIMVQASDIRNHVQGFKA